VGQLPAWAKKQVGCFDKHKSLYTSPYFSLRNHDLEKFALLIMLEFQR